MAKEKFVYNKHTLRYEQVTISTKTKVLRALGVFTVIAVFAIIVGIITLNLFEAPSNQVAKNELEIMSHKYEELNGQLNQMSAVLENIQERDAGIYRQILEMNPTDDNVWAGGRGGADRYEDIRGLSESELLVRVAERMSKLRHRLAVQAKSQDEIIEAAKDKENMLAAIPSIKPIRPDKLQKKLEHMSGFGMRLHPIHKIYKMHYGIDFGARTGTPIHATGDGKVVRVEFKSTGYGRNVILDHGYGYQTLYAHMSKVKVKPGQKVKKGDIIGLVGSTGSSTSPHLHYEVHYRGERVDPINFCLDGLTPKEYKELQEMAAQQNQAMSID